MVVVKLLGGLGNQLFQYASSKALAMSRNQKLYIDKSAFKNYDLHDYGLHHFNINSKLYKPNSLVKAVRAKFNLNSYYNEDSFAYNEAVFNSNSRHVFLNGYFQSEQYFLNYRKELLEELKIIAPLKNETLKVLENINNTSAVSIHIRRGDFLKHEKHNTAKDNYYLKAMKIMEEKIENPTYYLFSDDMAWVKANFKTNFETIYVDFNDASSNFEDLKLMTACKHNIIANSSFSWWAAWLNSNPNKIVIAPEQWFNSSEQDYSDVVPKSWIKI